MIPIKYYLFIDDSGQLHPNYPYSDIFIYGGLLMEEKVFHKFNEAYKNIIEQIKREKNISGELKTSAMDIPTKRRLLKYIKKQEGIVEVFVSVKIPLLLRLDFNQPKDVNRYKNYIIRRLLDQIKLQSNQLDQCTLLDIYIDNQNVAHSAIESLSGYLNNIYNENRYDQIGIAATTVAITCDYKVYYRDSSNNYCIQAADLLANSYWQTFRDPKLSRGISKLLKEDKITLKLPDFAKY